MVLRLNGCGVQSLKNFPNLTELVRLELINNNFGGDDLVNLAHLTVNFHQYLESQSRKY